MSTELESVLLHPRPFAGRYAGTLRLVRLLPPKPAPTRLPSELWSVIFSHVEAIQVLLSVSKQFKEIALPILYADVRLRSSLGAFTTFAVHQDRLWDSLCRIPYSTPGRWVRKLDVSCISPALTPLSTDNWLLQLFPLLPFLDHLTLNPGRSLSTRTLSCLASRDGAHHLRVLRGVGYAPSPYMRDSMVQLLRSTPLLEELEVIGRDTEVKESSGSLTMPVVDSLHLPQLHTLTLLSLSSSPLYDHLIRSQLPSLRKVTLTPYGAESCTLEFVETHGKHLRSLLLLTRKAWPTVLHPSPTTLLQNSPGLRHLSLELPLPTLVPESGETHPLRILSIPRPSPHSWAIIERLLPQLPCLEAIRARDVHWLRQGMTSRAQEAGVQGEMREWWRRLTRRRVKFLDADWQEGH